MNKNSVLLLIIGLASPFVVFADSSITNPLGNATICSLLVGILNAFMIIGAPIAVVFVIIAGWQFVWARGNPSELGKARQNIVWTLVGIAIFFGAIVITQVIFKTVSGFLSKDTQSPLECSI